MKRLDRLYARARGVARELHRALPSQTTDEARALVRRELWRIWGLLERIEKRLDA